MTLIAPHQHCVPNPASAAADHGLSVPFSAELLAPFENYASFCRDFGIPPLSVGAETSHIVGARKLDQNTYSTVFGILLDRAVERRMGGRRRIGIFLSGGYDSRSAAAAIRE